MSKGDWVFHKDYGWTKITWIDGVLLRIYGEPLSYPKGCEVHFWKDDVIDISREYDECFVKNFWDILA